MPYVLERSTEGHKFAQGKAIVVNTMTGKHFSKSPIPLAKAEKQMRLLEGIEHGMIPKHQKEKESM
jgi:hypothetical protein